MCVCVCVCVCVRVCVRVCVHCVGKDVWTACITCLYMCISMMPSRCIAHQLTIVMVHIVLLGKNVQGRIDDVSPVISLLRNGANPDTTVAMLECSNCFVTNFLYSGQKQSACEDIFHQTVD